MRERDPTPAVASRRRRARASSLAGSGRARCASATRCRGRLPAETRALRRTSPGERARAMRERDPMPGSPPGGDARVRRISPGAGARDARARPDAGVASRRRRARASSLAGRRARAMRERDPMPGSPPGGDARAHRDRPASRIRDARTRPARGSPPIPGARAHDEGEATPMNRAPDQDSSGRGAGTATRLAPARRPRHRVGRSSRHHHAGARRPAPPRARTPRCERRKS